MAKDGLGKLSNSLIEKIRGVSPTTAEVIQSAGMTFLKYCAENNLTEESLNKYAMEFIDKSFDGADKNDIPVLTDMKTELESTNDSEEKIAKVGSMVAVAKQSSEENRQDSQEEQRLAAESRKRKISWKRI